MPELIDFEEQREASEAFTEHVELSHYIDIFRLSAERVRYLVFIIAVFSVVMLVALWNTTPWSWVHKRYEGLRLFQDEANSQKAPDVYINSETNGHIRSSAELKEKIHQYKDRRFDKVYFPEIPALAITFDINDLGNFCGVAYWLLLLLLTFSLMREHENLYLALFKVRKLHDQKKGGLGGESRANYLYHALAMSQILNSPPTLAQWRPARLKSNFLSGLFLVPILVEAGIMLYDLKSIEEVKYLHVTPRIMAPEFVFSVFNFALCLICILYFRDCDRMWRRAFLHINPSLEHVESRPLPLWARPRSKGMTNDTWRRLSSQIISDLVIKEPEVISIPMIECEQDIAGDRITSKNIQGMCESLEARAMETAGVLGVDFPHIISSTVKESLLKGGKWVVRADFHVHTLTPLQRTYLLFFRMRRMQSVKGPFVYTRDDAESTSEERMP